jgi:nucleoside-diphosphate-sugar epimerase
MWSAINVVEAARRAGFGGSSTCDTLCYGRPDTVPIPVDHPTRPFTNYGISKTAGEAILRSASAKGVVAAGQYQRSTSGDRPDPDLLASKGRTGLLVLMRCATFSIWKIFSTSWMSC